jgi:hypothetical protein
MPKRGEFLTRGTIVRDKDSIRPST